MLRKLQFNSLNTQTNVYRSIIELALNSRSSDLYFYDKSFPLFHVSFHRDNSVWIRSNNREIPANKIFEANDGAYEGLDPIIYYIPLSNKYYPTARKKRGRMQLDLNIKSDEEIQNLILNIFRIIGDPHSDKIPDVSSGSVVIRSEGETSDGVKVEPVVLKNPMLILQGKHVSIVPRVINLERPDELLNLKRMLFIVEPNKTIDMKDLFGPKGFVFDGKVLSKQLISMSEKVFNDTKVVCYVY